MGVQCEPQESGLSAQRKDRVLYDDSLRACGWCLSKVKRVTVCLGEDRESPRSSTQFDMQEACSVRTEVDSLKSVKADASLKPLE